MVNRNKKPGFFEKIFGGRGEVDDYFEDDESEDEYEEAPSEDEYEEEEEEKLEKSREDEPAEEMAINLIDRGDTLEICAPVPGAGPDEIDISITRELITITTSIQEKDIIKNGEFLYREAYIGRASRSLMLPVEIDVEGSTAEVKDGLLLIAMPKISKYKKKRKLSVERKK